MNVALALEDATNTKDSLATIYYVHGFFRCKNDTGELVPCPREQEYKQMCAIIIHGSGPFSECHWLENPDPYYESCVYDLCQYGLGNRMLCAAIDAYDEMCTIVGVKVPNWRRTVGCSKHATKALSFKP